MRRRRKKKAINECGEIVVEYLIDMKRKKYHQPIRVESLDHRSHTSSSFLHSFLLGYYPSYKIPLLHLPIPNPINPKYQISSFQCLNRTVAGLITDNKNGVALPVHWFLLAVRRKQCSRSGRVYGNHAKQTNLPMG